MKKNKRIILLVLMSLLSLFVFVGCGDTETTSSSSDNFVDIRDGQEITLSEMIIVCSSKDNVDHMLDYVSEENQTAINRMFLDGEAKYIQEGEKVTIVDTGFSVTEIQDANGETWFTIKDSFSESD